MKKDIFIDNNIASKFSNPMDKEYLKLIQWLQHFDESDRKNIHNYAHLVVSKKLLVEYYRSNQHAAGATSIPLIVAQLQAEGRWSEITNEQIKEFKAAHFSKKNVRKLRSNNEDREHIPVVLLSDRKFALAYDNNFISDLEDFPGFTVTVTKRPENLPYSE